MERFCEGCGRNLEEKTLVNELLRRGFYAAETENAHRKMTLKPFRTRRVKSVTDDQIAEMLKEI